MAEPNQKDRQNLEGMFEAFVAELFLAEGFKIETPPAMPNAGARPDLMVISPTGVRALVEAKLYRSRLPTLSLIHQAAANLDFSRRVYRTQKAILVIGNSVAPDTRLTLAAEFADIVLYDAGTLAFLVIDHPNLRQTFEYISRNAPAFSEPTEPQVEKVDIQADISAPATLPPVPPTARRKSRGEDLCKQIRAIPPGNGKSAKLFETKVTEALQYIFENDLAAWSMQKQTATGMSAYDAVVRVASNHDFWNAIANQFRSRYVIFEFKNHGGKIRQTQIYTTEKYLFVAALRATAIIISRRGADQNALKAASGALRESGKLIVNLDVDDVCDMLALRDRGSEYNIVLVDRVDEMLMKLER